MSTNDKLADALRILRAKPSGYSPPEFEALELLHDALAERVAKPPANGEVSPRDVAIPAFYEAEEAACVHLCLDDRRVPRAAANGEAFSLWGRVCEYLRMQAPDAVNAYCAEAANETQLTKEKS